MMRALCLLCVGLVGCSPAPHSPWSGAWKGDQATLWLESNGDFVSLETPVAETKPTGVTLLHGRWDVAGTEIELVASETARVYPALDRILFGSVQASRFVTHLKIRPDRMALICGQLHLYPLPGASGYSFTLTRATPSPAPVDWQGLVSRIDAAAKARPAPVIKTLPIGASPKGKTY